MIGIRVGDLLRRSSLPVVVVIIVVDLVVVVAVVVAAVVLVVAVMVGFSSGLSPTADSDMVLRLVTAGVDDVESRSDISQSGLFSK